MHLVAELDVSPDRAYALFTEKASLEGWLTTIAEVEPRLGGRYELFWDPGNRSSNSTLGCRITAYDPGRLLAFDWRSPAQFERFANAADPLTHVVVTFASAGAGTVVHLVHSGWRSSPEWEEARAWQERAWSLAFQGLPEAARAARR